MDRFCYLGVKCKKIPFGSHENIQLIILRLCAVKLFMSEAHSYI